MPPRSSQIPPKGSFNPPYDANTYRDLLLFEERLKSNAASLNRRKHRYQLFLAQLLLIIAFLLSEVLLQTNFLAIPYKLLLCRVLPELYTENTDVTVHPYFASGLLFVSVTTLVLFFASGMYSEKIGYANRYVPHANRALRSFNMYLNVRQPPLQSKLPFNIFSFLFPRPSPTSSPSPQPSRRTRSPSPSSPSKRSSSVPIAPIPPASNPRGELIFSSRVDRSFRDSYERYRSAFERKREERERDAFAKTWRGWIYYKLPWVNKNSFTGSVATGSGPGLSRPGSASGSLRGRGSGGPTPSESRRSSPIPSRPSRQGSTKSGGIARTRTPPSGPQHPLASETHGVDGE